jgi:large subunit ribosomal protein L17
MRHRKHKKTIDRKTGPRKALIKNLACQLILYEKIKTTDVKAKVLRSFTERLITRGKKDNLSNRRLILAILPIKSAVKKVFEVLGPRYKERQGGYTRIIKLGQRKGDAANIVQIELV